MIEYGKTENIYARDMEADRHPLIRGLFRMPEVAIVDTRRWIATEKIDGTNVRIIITPHGRWEDGSQSWTAELRGRSDRANLLKGLSLPVIDQVGVALVYEGLDLPPDVVLTFYGEAYGAGIQSGGGYSDTKRIRVFDFMTSRPPRVDDQGVATPEWSHAWRGYGDMLTAVDLVGLTPVPEVGFGVGLDAFVGMVEAGFSTLITDEGGSGCEAEGVVIRTDPYVYDGRGRRVMAKIKTRDLRS